MYNPKPIDTSKVLIGQDLLKLTELLARNAHDNWAAQRLKDGWRWGPRRDDSKKEHPGLVPYEELHDSEREYDRRTAMETVRAVLALGYALSGPRRAEEQPLDEKKEFLRVLLSLLGSAIKIDTAELLRMWSTRDAEAWECEPEAYRALGRRFLAAGEPLMAHDVSCEGLGLFPGDLELAQQKALALARSGATAAANSILEGLRRDGRRDEETTGLLARTHKDLWLVSAEGPAKQEHLGKARELYQEAYRQSGGTWTGINAASLGLLMGLEDEARRTASEVEQKCLSELRGRTLEGKDAYWLYATLGEAKLVQGDPDSAGEWYLRGARLAEVNHGDIASTRRNAGLILEKTGQATGLLDKWLPLPPVVVMVGGDDAGAGDDGREEALRSEISSYLDLMGRAIGFSGGSLADLLFCQAVQERGGEAHLVLPCRADSLLEDNLPSEDDRKWARGIISRAVQVLETSGERLDDAGLAEAYTGQVLAGLAIIRARQLGARLAPVMVLSGIKGPRHEILEGRWKKLGHDLHVMDVGLNAGRTRKAEAREEKYHREQPGKFRPKVAAMLFADAVGFSKLREAEIRNFIEYFLGGISRLLITSGIKPLARNTWGDGLFMVFESIRDAGRLGLELANLVTITDWPSLGLPQGMNIRIALHAGPVYEITDPVTGQHNYAGSHVSRAARIEPVTPPGQVYASQAFAALAAAGGITEFCCDYVGQLPLAKGYGSFPMYHLRMNRQGL